jgi:cell division transport system permease protein
VSGRRRLDLPLAQTAPGRLLPWLSGGLVYLTVLMLGIAAIADQALRALDHRARLMTVTLPLVDARDAERDLAAALDVLYEERFVLTAEPVSQDELRLLMMPWLGAGRAGSLPLPGMIDVAVDPLAEPDLAALQGALSGAVPGATLALDPTTPDRTERVAALLRGWSGGLAAVALVAALVAMAAMTRQSLRLCRDAVALLRWMGASPGYLAAQYERYALAGSLRGGSAGFCLAALTVIPLIASMRRMAVAEPIELGLRPLDWGLLSATAACLVLLAVAVVRATAHWQLQRAGGTLPL